MQHIYRITAKGLAVSKSINAPDDENWRTLRAIAKMGLADDSRVSAATGLSTSTVRIAAGRLKRQRLVEEG